MSASKGGGAPAIRYRPIYGGIFGKSGEYVLGTMACMERGLHAVRFMVLHPRTGGVLSVAASKTDALDQARRVLKAAAVLTSANDTSFVQGSLWSEQDLPVPAAGAAPKPVSRRRRQIFEKAGGRCAYCSKPITIDAFHVDHQWPRALGGTDAPINLVAVCPPCNLAKSDQTALEYVARTTISG